MLLWPLLACAPTPSASPAPVAPESPPSSPSAAPFRLVALGDDSHLPLPAMPTSQRSLTLGDACYNANKTLTALDPRHPGTGPPCGAEDWSDGSTGFEILWAGDAAAFIPAAQPADAREPDRPAAPAVDRPHPAIYHWNSIDPVLAACLGPPLNLPPAGDPGGQRATDGTWWTIVLTGENRCAVAGTLRLNIRADRAEAQNLSVHGTPWLSGGAALAAKALVQPPPAPPSPAR